MKLILKTDHTITGQNITFISPEYCISWPYHDDHLLPLPARSSSSFRAVYQFFHDIIAGISSAIFICDHFVTQAEFVSFCHSRGIRHFRYSRGFRQLFGIHADFVGFRHWWHFVTFAEFVTMCRLRRRFRHWFLFAGNSSWESRFCARILIWRI